MKIIFYFILLIASNGFSATYVIPSLGYSDVANSVIEIPNMPRIRSQDHLGICHAFSATALAQKYYCDLQKIQNCSEVSPEKEISPLSVLSFSKIDEKKKIENILINDRSLNIKEGGYSFLNLWNAQESFSFFQEACFPFDQFVERFGQSKEMMNTTISKLERYYNKNKKSSTEADAVEACPSCLQDENEVKNLVASIFPQDKYQKKIEYGLTKNSFPEFLYETLFAAGCKKINMPSPKVNLYPDFNQESTDAELANKIKEVLASGVPLQISNVSAVSNNVKENHHFVISGFKKVCKPNGECLDLVKAHNSWGKEWQDKAKGGWLVLNDLLVNKEDRVNGKHKVASISWLTEKK